MQNMARTEPAMTFQNTTVTTDGTRAELTGPREEVLELLSYGALWAHALREEAKGTPGAPVWTQRWRNLNRLFRSIAR